MSSAANKIPLEYEKLWVKHSPYWRHWKYQYMRTLSSKSELIENDLFKTISKGIFLVYTVAVKIWVIFSKTRKLVKMPEKIDFFTIYGLRHLSHQTFWNHSNRAFLKIYQRTFFHKFAKISVEFRSVLNNLKKLAEVSEKRNFYSFWYSVHICMLQKYRQGFIKNH